MVMAIIYGLIAPSSALLADSIDLKEYAIDDLDLNLALSSGITCVTR